VVEVMVYDYYSKKRIGSKQYSRVPVEKDYIEVNVDGVWYCYQVTKVLLLANDNTAKVIAVKREQFL
jgi:hypothetical protein